VIKAKKQIKKWGTLPKFMLKYFKAYNKIAFEEKPNYKALRKIFKKHLKRMKKAK
jgi:hypothetical protein